MFACITVDLDTLHHYRAIHGLPPSPADATDPTYTLGVSRMLELFEEFAIPATLFVIGMVTDVPDHAAYLRRANALGHELGNHTYHHRYDLRAQTGEQIEDDIRRGEDAIEAITGSPPVGFRTPGYNVDDEILSTLVRRGYLYDSSVLSAPPYYLAKALVMATRAVRGQPSRSQMTLPRNLTAPTTPYRPSSRSFARRGDLPLTEIPMPVLPGLGVPIIGTSLHLFGRRGFDLIYPALRRVYRPLFQLEFHALDFIDASDPGVDETLAHLQPDLRVPWRDKRALYEHVFIKLRRRFTFSTLEDAVRACFM